MQLKRNEMYKSVVVFFVIDDMITQEKKQKLLFFFFFLGGGGCVIAKVLKLAVICRTKFRNTHWLEKSLNCGR